MKIWPRSEIRELLALAERTGIARATLGSPDEAAKFRFAIYTFRRTHGTKFDFSVVVEGNDVVVRQNEMPSITIHYNEGCYAT